MPTPSDTDTICARATPPGTGPIAIVRLSGPEAIALVDRCFAAHRRDQSVVRAKSHSLIFGRISDPRTRAPVDDVLVSVMRGPHSYTGEDVVEINCHGSLSIVRALLSLLCDLGARLAEPGEFTRRAFENGQVDLAQAEAVCDIISAQTRAAAEVALHQLGGALSQRLGTIRGLLVDFLAEVEGHLDFPEEHLPPLQMEQWSRTLESAREEIARLRSGGERGRLLREGARAVLVGKPNAGKSSLFNRLVGDDRAIVTAHPGTTRDSLEALIEVEGLPLVVVDTAGVREAAGEIERLGVDRTERAMRQASAVLVCVPADEPWAPEDDQVWEMAEALTPLVTLTKCDLRAVTTPDALRDRLGVDGVHCTSAATGEGIEDLVRILGRQFFEGTQTEEGADPLVSNERHLEALRRAEEGLVAAAETLSRPAGELELGASDLRRALSEIDLILGLDIGDDVLDRIFSRFCIGK